MAQLVTRWVLCGVISRINALDSGQQPVQ